jgi:glycosyltransferase involved in cell wall biosynthesis
MGDRVRTRRVCFFGTYTTAQGYPVNRVILKGLRRAGITVDECRQKLWEGFLHELFTHPKLSVLLSLCWRLPLCYGRLLVKYLAMKEHQWIIVGYPGYIDVLVARTLNWRRRRRIALVAFISLYDTAVLDRAQVSTSSWKGTLLKALDRISFAAADVVLVDTNAHGQHFSDLFGLPRHKFVRSFVGEDDDEFRPCDLSAPEPALPGFDVLFFGTYVPLHGIDVIVDAAHLLSQEKDINITVIGTGQLFPQIRQDAERREVNNIVFIDRWMGTDELIAHIESAHACLGIFGSTPKAGRVIPYKVFDALAMHKPVITRDSPAVRELLVHDESALLCAPEGQSLASALLRLRDEPDLASRLADNGYQCYRQHGSPEAVGRTLVNSLEAVAA